MALRPLHNGYGCDRLRNRNRKSKMSRRNNPIDEELSLDDPDFDLAEDKNLYESEDFAANTENNDQDPGADSPSLLNKLKLAGKNIAVGKR